MLIKTIKTCTFILWILSVSLFNGVRAEDYTNFSLGGEKLYNIEVDPAKLGGSKVFRLVFPRNLFSDEDVSLSVKPTEPKSDPDLYVFNQYPIDFTKSLYESISLGTDVLLIPFSDLQKTLPKSQNVSTLEQLNAPIESEYYVFVECFRSCSFYFSAEYTRESFFELAFDEGQNLMRAKKEILLGKKTNALLKVFIPKNSSIERIRFDLSLLEIKKRQEPFEIYIKMDNEIPSSSYTDYIALPNWDYGKTIAIERGGFHFCVGCNYTILIEGEKNSKLTLEVRADEKATNLQMFLTQQDIVLQGKTNLYKLEVSENVFNKNMKAKTVYVTLNVYSGNPDLYVNPDSNPLKLENYRWSTNSEYTKVLVLTPKDRTDANATDKTYFIAVYGNQGSAYSLTFSLNKNNDGRLLKPGVLETGWVLKNEIVNYNLKLSGGENFQVSVRLIAKQGNPDLYIKLCDTTRKSSCTITLNEVENKASDDGSQLFLYSNKEGSVDFLQFMHETARCSDTKGVCFYAVAVIGSSIEKSSFELTVFFENQHIMLSESSLNKVALMRGEKKFFRFLLPTDDDVNKVSFIVTPINGAIKMFVSKTNKFPDTTENDLEYYFSSFLDMISFKKDETNKMSLKGEYFITTFGQTAAFFTLRTVVGRTEKNNTIVTKFLSNLEEGVPQDYGLDHINELHYFRITLGEERNDEDVIIKFTPVRGIFEILVNNNATLPSNTSFSKKFSGADLIISPDEESIQANKKGDYTILILPVAEEINNITGTALEFSIQYSLGNTLKLLKVNQAYNETLKKKNSRFKYEFFQEGSASSTYSIVLTHFSAFDSISSTSGLVVYGSFSSDNTFPTQSKSNFTLTEEARVYQIKDAALRGICSETSQCLIYLNVVGQPGNDFSLLLKRDIDSAILIRDRILEVPLRLNIPKDNIFLYNYLFYQESLVINAYLPGASLRIWAKFVEKFMRKPEDFPSEDSFDLSSGPEQPSFAFIPIFNASSFVQAKSQGKIKIGGALTIKIEVVKSSESEKAFNMSTLTVLISQGRETQLPPDVPLVNLNSRLMESQNFTFKSKNENMSQVSVTTLSYCKISDYSETYMQNFSKKYLNLTWETPCLYAVNRFRQQEDIITINEGVPLELELAAGEFYRRKVQLDYYHGGDVSFRIVVVKDYGDFRAIVVNSARASKPEITFTNLIKDNSFQEIIEVNKDRADFCNNCKYNISIIPLTNSKLTVYVLSGYSRMILREGQTVQDNLGFRSKNVYFLYRGEKSRFYKLQVQVLIGKIDVIITGESAKGLSDSRIQVEMGPENYFVKEFDIETIENLRKNENTPINVVVSGNPGSRYLISVTAISNPKIMRPSVNIMEFLKSNKELVLQFNTSNWEKTNLTGISVSLNYDQFDIDGYASMDMRDLFPVPMVKPEKGYAYDINMIQTERNLLILMPYSLKASHNLTLRNVGFSHKSFPKSESIKPINLMLNTRLLTTELTQMTRGERLISPIQKGQANFYSINLDQGDSSTLLVSIAECNEPIDIKVASKLEHLKSNVFDISGVHTMISSRVSTYEVKQRSGEIFFSLNLKEKFSFEGHYSVGTYILPDSMKNPYLAFKLGSYNQWSENGGVYEIKSDKLLCAVEFCPSSTIKYKAFISSNPFIAERAPECGRELSYLYDYNSSHLTNSYLVIKVMQDPSTAKDGRATLSLSKEDLKKEGFSEEYNLFIGVVATVYLKSSRGNSNSHQEFIFSYPFIVIPGKQKEVAGKTSAWAILGIVLGALGGVLLFGIICWRLRKLKIENSVEKEYKRPSVSSLTVTRDFEMNDRYQALVDNSHL